MYWLFIFSLDKERKCTIFCVFKMCVAQQVINHLQSKVIFANFLSIESVFHLLPKKKDCITSLDRIANFGLEIWTFLLNLTTCTCFWKILDLRKNVKKYNQ